MSTSKSALIAALGRELGERLLGTFAEDDAAPRLTVARAAAPVAPARYAAMHRGSPAERQQLRAMYEQCLAAYRAARPEDTAANIDDAGAALAFFVCANFSVVDDLPVSQPMLDRVERQLAGLTRRLANWDDATEAQRQFYFEQMAMLGAFVAGRAAKAKQTSPAAMAEVKRAARSYLRHVLAVDADRIQLDARGLSLRTVAGKARSA